MLAQQHNAVALPQPKAIALLGDVMDSFDDYLTANAQDCYCDNPQCVRAVDSEGHLIPGATRRIPKGGKIYMSCVPCPGAREDHRGHFECGDCRAKGAMSLFCNGQVDCRACVAGAVDPQTGRQSRKHAVASEWLQRKVRDHKREAFNVRTYEQAEALAVYCRQIDEEADLARQDAAMAGGVEARAEALDAARHSEGRNPGESLEAWVQRRRELDDEINEAERALQAAKLAAGAPVDSSDSEAPPPAAEDAPVQAAADAAVARTTRARLMAASVALAAKQQEQQEVTGRLTRARTAALAAQAEHEKAAQAAEAQAELAAPEPTAEEMEQQRIKEAAKEQKRANDRKRRADAKEREDNRLADLKRKADESEELSRKLQRTEQQRAAAAGRERLLEHKLAVREVEIQRAEAAVDALEPFLRTYFKAPAYVGMAFNVDQFLGKWNMEVAKKHAAIPDAPELEAEPADSSESEHEEEEEEGEEEE
jgi:hypothetical protein